MNCVSTLKTLWLSDFFFLRKKRLVGQLDKFFIYRFLKEKAFKHMMHISDPTPDPKLQKSRINPKFKLNIDYPFTIL